MPNTKTLTKVKQDGRKIYPHTRQERRLLSPQNNPGFVEFFLKRKKMRDTEKREIIKFLAKLIKKIIKKI